MPSKGYKSYLIVGDQTTDWDTPVLTAAMKQIIYEFMTCGVRNVGASIVPTRFKGQPSPIRQIDGFYHAEGPVGMHLHANDMLMWWKHIFQATVTEIHSVDFTPQVVFADAAWTDPDSLDTQPGATTPSSSPGRLVFTFSAAKSGSIIITGTDQNGVAITETIVFDGDTTQTTTKYFATVDADGLDFVGIAANAHTLEIKCDKNTYTHTVREGDDISNGLTLEVVKGALPSVYIGCLLNQGTVDIADVITFTAEIMAKMGYNRYKVPVSGTDPTASTEPTNISGYTRVYDEVFPAWTLQITLDDGASATPVASASFVFNNQLTFPVRYRGVRTEPKPVRGDNREITLAVEFDYDTVNPDFDVRYLVSQDTKVVFFAESKPYAGPHLTFQLTFPRCQVAAFPDPEVSEYSEVLQSLSFRPIRTGNLPLLTLTDIVANGTTTLTSTTGGFTLAMEGSVIDIVGKGVFRIVTYTDTNTITVHATVVAGTDLVGRVDAERSDEVELEIVSLESAP